ncbi:hypothetical protein C2G38_2032995 [Gigaspora rosea]|uniref:F-box domain-containing protein n=1 Tax=Gigaspora rosea TaxID=44941 RepID=A0A397VMY6_9GLOM|nr:hypothetical protein C2G38_2032995 [Gigaspora rosea]
MLTFLKVLNLSRLEDCARKWINFHISQQKPIYISKDDLANWLFKSFIESGAILSKLDVYFTEVILKPEIFYSLGKNDHFFSRLHDVSVEVDVVTESYGFGIEVITEPFGIEDTIMLLRILAKNTKKIDNLKLKIFCNIYEPQIYYTLSNIIKSQEKLRRFSLICDEDLELEMHGVISALGSQKNSLQEIELDGCTCSTEFKVLNNCKNLEVLRILYGEEKKLLKVLDSDSDSDLCRISTLEINSYPIDASNLISILKKSGSLLQRLKLDSDDQEIGSQSLLQETLMASCPNITFLYISYIRLSARFLRLIENLRKLQFLTLRCIDDKEEIKPRVKQFAKILPPTLQYLEWVHSHNDILLNHCDAPLKRLVIDFYYDKEKTIKALIKFCTRKETLRYVSLSRYAYISSANDLDNLRKDLDKYVELVPYEDIEF